MESAYGISLAISRYIWKMLPYWEKKLINRNNRLGSRNCESGVAMLQIAIIFSLILVFAYIFVSRTGGGLAIGQREECSVSLKNAILSRAGAVVVTTYKNGVEKALPTVEAEAALNRHANLILTGLPCNPGIAIKAIEVADTGAGLSFTEFAQFVTPATITPPAPAYQHQAGLATSKPNAFFVSYDGLIPVNSGFSPVISSHVVLAAPPNTLTATSSPAGGSGPTTTTGPTTTAPTTNVSPSPTSSPLPSSSPLPPATTPSPLPSPSPSSSPALPSPSPSAKPSPEPTVPTTTTPSSTGVETTDSASAEPGGGHF